VLRDTMERHGFERYPFESWHFDLRHWKRYPVLDIDIDALATGESRAIHVPNRLTASGAIF
jgi:hypothetical protein